MKQGIYKDKTIESEARGWVVIDHMGKFLCRLTNNSGKNITKAWQDTNELECTTTEPIVTQEELSYFIQEMARRKGLL